MRNGWLIVNEFLQSDKFLELTELFRMASEQENMKFSVYTNAEIYAKMNPLGNHNGLKRRDLFGQGKKPDFVIFWDKDIFLAELLELQGISVYNSSSCIAVCDDKRKSYRALWEANLPIPQTIFAPMTYPAIGYTNTRFFDSVEKKLGYPLIVKEAFGSFGEQVYLVSDRKELQYLLEHTITSYELLFQEYIESSKGRDIRLQVVGNEVVAAMYRYSEQDFRANITAGGKMKSYESSEEEKKLAVAAARAVGADFAGVDLLFGKGEERIVCEVNSNAHFKNLLDCTNVNVAEKIFSYIKENRSWYAWLVYDEEGASKNADYITMHKEKGKLYGITFRLVLLSELEQILQEESPDFVIFRSICPFWTEKLEERGIPVFNNSKVSSLCNDKGKTIDYVRKYTNGCVRVPETKRYTAEELTEELLNHHKNYVVKAVAGHGGTQVFQTEDSFSKIKEGLGAQDFIMQPRFQQSDDIRVYVVGKKIIAAVKRTPINDFRANFSLGGKVSRYILTKEQRKIVQQVIDLFDFGLVGIDFFSLAEGELILNEIEDVVGARMLYACYPEIDLLGEYFSFILDKLLQ